MPQLAQERPSIEIKIKKVFKKPFLLFIFLLSLYKSIVSKKNKAKEKINNKIIINNGKLFNSLKSNNDKKNKFIFSPLVKRFILNIYKDVFIFLNKKNKKVIIITKNENIFIFFLFLKTLIKFIFIHLPLL